MNPRILLLCALLASSRLLARDLKGKVLLCYASGTPVDNIRQARPAAAPDTASIPTPKSVNGEQVARAVHRRLRERGIEVEIANLEKRQPTLEELGTADAVVFVSPVYFGGTHWAVKKLIDDRNGALYYARGQFPRMQRALVILVAEERNRVGGAAGDFNSAGSPFPGGGDRIDEVVLTTEGQAALDRAAEAASRLSERLRK